MKFCIIGLGQFGSILAIELKREGHEVIAVDVNENCVEPIKDKVDYALQADATDVKVLRKLGLQDIDTVVVAIGEDFESSLMIVAHLQEINVGSILCRVVNDVHERLLDLMHIDEKIRPEALAAAQLAKRMGITRAIRHFAMGEGYAIVEFSVPEALVGKTLAEAALRAKFKLNLITVKRPDKKTKGAGGKPAMTQGVPFPEMVFEAGDQLILFGEEAAIERFSKKFS